MLSKLPYDKQLRFLIVYEELDEYKQANDIYNAITQERTSEVATKNSSPQQQ